MNVLGKVSALVIGASTVYLGREYVKPRMCESTVKLSGKTAIITGANCGIGKETARDLCRRGAKVILACRDVKRGEEAMEDIRSSLLDETSGELQVYKLDLASIKSIRKFAEDIKKNESRIDILINNAGIGFVEFSRTEDGFERTIGVNHLGPFLLTQNLLEFIKDNPEPSRIINVSSRAHLFSNGRIDCEDLNYERRKFNSYRAYAESKFANILFTKELARRLRGTRTTVYALHPGTVFTPFWRYTDDWLEERYPWLISLFTFFKYFMKTPVEGAQTTIYCAVEESLEKESGNYYSNCARVNPHKNADDPELSAKLWSASEKLINT